MTVLGVEREIPFAVEDHAPVDYDLGLRRDGRGAITRKPVRTAGNSDGFPHSLFGAGEFGLALTLKAGPRTAGAGLPSALAGYLQLASIGLQTSSVHWSPSSKQVTSSQRSLPVQMLVHESGARPSSQVLARQLADPLDASVHRRLILITRRVPELAEAV